MTVAATAIRAKTATVTAMYIDDKLGEDGKRSLYPDGKYSSFAALVPA
jgi:hypothetical protein